MSDRASPVGGAPSNARGRTVFFSLCYDEDRHRADVVYSDWQSRHPSGLTAYVDSRISQPGKALGEDAVKRAIRDGVDQTTVTCALIGAHTWEDRWVRYEIARSVERGNGLFAVRINSIPDPKTQQRTVAGWNPLAYLGVGKLSGGDYLLFENINGQWIRYQDHPLTLKKPAYLPDMSVGYVQPLSVGLKEYDYVVQNGSENLDQWIAQAAAKTAR
jgi:MTH538 TIR-like domain (DUF1863)